MTVMEFIAIIGFAGLFLSAGIAIGRFVERLQTSVQNKNDRPK